MSNEAINNGIDDIVDADFDENDPDFQEVASAPAAAAPEFEPFSLTKERFQLASINTRGEKHGEDRVPALDLKFSATLSNSILLKLHPGLRDALYVQDRQTDIEADYGRKLRFPLLGTMPYDLEMPRVQLRVHDCDSDENDVVLLDGKANKFRITPMEGGSVAIAFRVQFSDYDTDVLAGLARVLQQAVPISLSCEAEEEKGDNFEQVEKVTQAPMSAARLAAEDMFANLPDDRSDTDAVIAHVTADQGGAVFPDDLANTAEQVQETAIAAEEAQPEASNVTPIKKPRAKRQANGAE